MKRTPTKRVSLVATAAVVTIGLAIGVAEPRPVVRSPLPPSGGRTSPPS